MQRCVPAYKHKFIAIVEGIEALRGRYLAEIATECDWMDENFEPRKTARDSEIAGLDDARSAQELANLAKLFFKHARA